MTLQIWQILVFQVHLFNVKNRLNHSDFFQCKIRKTTFNDDIFCLLFIFEAHYLLKLGPIFDDSLHNLGKRYKGDLMVIFDQWKKLCLGLNSEAEIQLLNCIYLIYRTSPRASRTLYIIVLVLITVYAMGPSVKYVGNLEGGGELFQVSICFPWSADSFPEEFCWKSKELSPLLLYSHLSNKRDVTLTDFEKFHLSRLLIS